MVYGGKPSTGCHLCRKRKIKCDEGQPECRNCLVYGKPCPGYRQDTIFRNETHKVERLVQKNKPSDFDPEGQVLQPVAGPVAATAPGVPDTTTASTITFRAGSNSSSISSSGSGSSQWEEQSPMPLFQIADSSWEDRAICYFFDQYTTFDDSTIGVSHLGFLPDLYALCREQGVQQEGSAESCLRRAVDATALMALGNESKVPFLTIRARNNYGLAIRELRQALYSRTQAVKDETFATLAILSLFEDIAGERNGLSSSHRVGFELLMKLRGASQLGHQQGRDLFNFAYTHTHVEILALGDRPHFDTDWIVGRLDTSDPVHRLISTATKVCQILLDASSSQSSPEGVDATKLATWIDSGKQLDQELAEWSQTLQNDWLPLIVHSHTTNEPLITYQALSLSVVWNFYRAVRVVLQRLMLELRRIRALFLGSFADDIEVLEIIHEMITDVCRSIPFSLGDIDTLGNPTTSASSPSSQQGQGKPRIRAFHGYSLLWPFWYVLACGLANPEQEQQIRNALVRVGSELGIRLALRLAETVPAGQGEEFQFGSPMGFPV